MIVDNYLVIWAIAVFVESRVQSGIQYAALEKAAQLNITGKDITPFLLDTIQHLTEGRSLESNVRLVYNNARLAAEIAIAYATAISASGNHI